MQGQGTLMLGLAHQGLQTGARTGLALGSHAGDHTLGLACWGSDTGAHTLGACLTQYNVFLTYLQLVHLII
jgi:hypothetical protein